MPDLSRYFLTSDANLVDLSAWSTLLPERHRTLSISRFADVFLAELTNGTVYMLSIAEASISQIALSEEEFWKRCFHEKDAWLLAPLMKKCEEAGMTPGDDQCYAFTTLPFLGGKYAIDNIWVCSWKEWFSFAGHIHLQTKDLPDGAEISLRVVD